MAKSKKKPKAKPLPEKNKGPKKKPKPARPVRGFDMVRLNDLVEHVAELADRVQALERREDTTVDATVDDNPDEDDAAMN